MPEKPSRERLLERLIEASTFGLDDLEQNRQGRMSGLQRSRLAFMTFTYFGMCALSLTLAGCTLWLWLTLFKSIPFLTCLIFVILCTYAGYYWLRHALPMWEDVRSNAVLRISGPVHLIYVKIANRPPTYAVHYKIAQKFFDMAFLAPQLFPNDQSCHAYYAPRSEIIVGIEPT